jgi:lipocalin
MLAYIIFYILLSSGVSISPVDKVDIGAYIGRWYQVIGSEFNLIFMSNGSCITADYGLGENNITVLNSEFYHGKLEQITGYAKNINPNVQGELAVYLHGVPAAGQYYIYDLGDIVNGQYSYSVISDQYFITLFVLVRNISFYHQFLESKLEKEINNLGFKYVYDVDQTNCTYA